MRGNGTRFIVISFRSTFSEPSNRAELNTPQCNTLYQQITFTNAHCLRSINQQFSQSKFSKPHTDSYTASIKDLSLTIRKNANNNKQMDRQMHKIQISHGNAITVDFHFDSRWTIS